MSLDYEDLEGRWLPVDSTWPISPIYPCSGCRRETSKWGPHRRYCASCDGTTDSPLLRFLTPTVCSLALAVYEERDPASGHLDPVRLAILADALEEAGCDAGLLCLECVRFARLQTWEFLTCHGTPTAIVGGELLAHLRSPGPHVRGCWAIDLVLGRE